MNFQFIGSVVSLILIFILVFFCKLPFFFEIIVSIMIGIGCGFIAAILDDHFNNKGGDDDVDKTS